MQLGMCQISAPNVFGKFSFNKIYGLDLVTSVANASRQFTAWLVII